MSTVHSNPQERLAAADAAQRRFFPDAFKEEALRSGDQDLIADVLEAGSISISKCETVGFAKAVRRMASQD